MTKHQHIISTQQFLDPSYLSQLFDSAKKLEELDARHQVPPVLNQKIIATLFYEPSTRTRLSFEAAIQKLGGLVITTESASHFSSAIKGETLEDTIRIIGGYADAIVLRHFDEGAANRAAKVSSVPIINAGDGKGEHPTQALLDLYTIWKEQGRTNELSIGLIGDLLNGRTIHSLIYLLALYPKNRIFLIAPQRLALPDNYLNHLAKQGVEFIVEENLNSVLGQLDVLYMTRIQKERFESVSEYEELKDYFVLDYESLKKIKKEAVIMHPLPRVTEIDPSVDTDPRAAYFRQAKNGLYVRMALLGDTSLC